MSGTTWSKFYWADWESDERLKQCSPGAQALWMRMLCLCAKADGYLTIAGKKLNADDMAVQTGWPVDDVRKWWAELARWEVFSVEGRGKVFSRKMVKDLRKAGIARENGKTGGNPNLRKDTASAPLDNPTPTDALTKLPGSLPSAISQKEDRDADASLVGGKPLDEIKVAVELWNALAERAGLPKAIKVDRGRRAAIRARLADGGLETWRKALEAVERSGHCRGEGERGWRADIDFVCQPKSWRRLLEGFYRADVTAAPAADAPPPTPWPGPAEIRADIVTAKGEAFARSYLDPAGWRNGPARLIICRNEIAAGKLNGEVPDVLERHRVATSVERPA
jgi:hypothetical protein